MGHPPGGRGGGAGSQEGTTGILEQERPHGTGCSQAGPQSNHTASLKRWVGRADHDTAEEAHSTMQPPMMQLGNSSQIPHGTAGGKLTATL